MRRLINVVKLAPLTAALWFTTALPAQTGRVEWVGRGAYRALVRVAPADIGRRASDQRPAEVALDYARDLAPLAAAAGRIDVNSVQVVRYDPATGRPLAAPKFAYGTTPWDAPSRWYDAAIPYDFPEFEGRVAATRGELGPWQRYPRWGYLYGTVGDWQRGRLAWLHTQDGQQPSHYAIYFDLLPADKPPVALPPQGFVGDGMERRDKVGHTSTGLIHSRVAVDDWDGDGLPDLVLGSARGGVIIYPNTGTKHEPQFSYSKLIFTADGNPLDVGLTAAPTVVDWDGDGAKDLLVGAQSNRLMFIKNGGTNGARSFINRGFVQVEGQPLALPHKPVPEGNGVWKDDYYPVPEVADWDGDGDLDLLAGGYVTGQVFYFEAVGRAADGTPLLKARGPLETDAGPVDVGWCAAPAAADFDGDGDLDLIAGGLPKTPEGSDSADADSFLAYFENVGARGRPLLKRREFPKRGAFPKSSLSTPRALDFNHDGLLDLVVSARENLYLYKNAGRKGAPLFEAHTDHLPSAWGNAPVGDLGMQFVDWNGDGLFDIVNRFTVRINEGKGSPGVFSPPKSLLAAGETISHPAPMGDDYAFTQLADLDGDGRLDILFGDHGGHIYFHRNQGPAGAGRFETKGVKLTLAGGRLLKVGPPEGTGMDFQVLQGARTTFAAADFDRDGKLDLVVGDTYGTVRYYQNLSAAGRLVFAEPVVVGEMKRRMRPAAADWNNDGYPDVIGAAAGGSIQLFLNQSKAPGRATFAPGQNLDLPGLPYWPAVGVVDWNGDGDEDAVIATAYSYFALAERSYLEHGYGRGELLSVERRPLKAALQY